MFKILCGREEKLEYRKNQCQNFAREQQICVGTLLFLSTIINFNILLTIRQIIKA